MLGGIIISSSFHHHLPVKIVIIWQWAWQGWDWPPFLAQRRDPSREKGPVQGHSTGLARLSRLQGGAVNQGVESRSPLGKVPFLKRKAGSWAGVVSLPNGMLWQRRVWGGGHLLPGWIPSLLVQEQWEERRTAPREPGVLGGRSSSCAS